MAAIAEIRVVNLHYAKQNNYYDDLTFRFLSEAGIPSNGAITFPNGNGKGALLQAINQIFLPETQWGNKNENTPLHYFMKGKKFAPYTFYIIIEWWISYTRRLMTGIVMTAEEITDLKPEYRIKYRLFGKKYVKNEYTIQQLPIWNPENNTVKDFSLFETYVKDQKGMFSYSPSGKGNFFKECRTHGVFESDWAELKKINRYEAGIGPYFEQKNATKNETFFRHMLIPSIVERNEIVNDIDIQSQLSQQFKDSATIANNLPHLLAREKYHQEILEMVSLFDGSIQNYQFAANQIKEHKRTGENILGNMDAKLQELEKQAEEIDQHVLELVERQDRNHWEKNNLKYVKASRELQEKQEEQSQADLAQKEATSDKDTADKKQQEADKKLLVKKYRVEEKKYQTIEADIKRLEQSAEMKEIVTKEQCIKQTIEEQWAGVKEELQRVQMQYQGYAQQKKQEANKLVQENQDLATAIGGLNVQLTSVAKRIQEYASVLEKAKEKFGYSVHVKPEEAKATLQKEIEDTQALKEAAEKEAPSLLAMQEKLAEELWTLNNEKTTIEKQQREIKERLPQQQQKQFEWVNQVARLLKLTTEECGATYNWLQSVLPFLQDLLEKRVKREKELTVELLKLEQQLQISDEDRFLLNADIQRISEKLEHYNIYHQTGSEFLMELKEEERKRYNRQYPSLKYSIIVQAHNLQDLRQKLQFTDELLQSPVNIVEAKQFDQMSDTSFLFLNQADEFVEQPEKWNEFLRVSLEEKSKLEDEILKVSQEREEIHLLIQDLQRFPRKDSTDALTEELDRLKEKHLQCKNEQITKGTVQTELKKKIEDNKTKQKEAEITLQEKKSDERGLETFVERLHQHQGDVTLESKLATELAEKQEKLKKFTQQANDRDEELKEWQIYYAEWKAQILQKVERISKIIPSVVFPKESEVEAGTEEISAPYLPSTLFNTIMESVAQHEELTHSLEQKSSQIAELKGMNKVNIGLLQEAKEELLACDQEGLSLLEPVEPLDFLKQQKERTAKNAQHAVKRLQTAEKSFESLTAVVKQIEDQVNGLIEDIRLNHARSVEDWVNIDIEVKGKEIAEEYNWVQAELSTLDKASKELQTMKNTLEKARPMIAVQIGAPPSMVFTIQEAIDRLIDNIQPVVGEWSQEFDKRKRRKAEASNALTRVKRKSLEDIKEANWDEKTKQNILEQYNSMDVANLPSTIETIEGIRTLSKYELEVMEEDKKKGVEARERWVKYAAQFSSNIVKSIFEMADSMEVKNRGGFTFPLAKIRNKRKLSTKTGDYQIALERYFDESIKKANQKGIPVESMTIREINQIINIADIVYTALGNQYPLFDIYFLDKENVFMYDEPRPEYFVDWEVLNEGSLTNPAGSGGQKVAGRTIMFLMMMSHKRKVAEKDWQFFYMDNPFANAISASVVDPIFAITEALNYQLIVVAPPELMKAEISMKFPSLHDLSFEKEQTGKSKVLVTRRQYLLPSIFMTEAFEDEVVGFSTVKNTDVEQGEFILD